MIKRFKHSRGFEGSRTNKRKKSRQIQHKDVHSSSPNSLDDTHEKQPKRGFFKEEDEVELKKDEGSEEEEEVEEMVVEREPSIYDTLVNKLETRSKSRDNHSLRKCNEKRVCNNDEENDSEGTNNNTSGFSTMGDASKLSEDEASDIAMYDDDVSDAEDNSIGSISSSASESKFVTHTTHKLSEQDTEALLKRKWEYKWDMPAFDSTTVKWMGTGESFIKDADVAARAPFGLKLKLYKHWLEIYNAAGGKSFESSKQINFFNLCSSYRDILHHQKKGFYQKGSEEDSSIMDSYIMHSFNHAFKTRDLVTKNTAKLAKNKEASNEELGTANCFLDHGFTRPKVLILLPLASIAHRLVRRLVHLTPSAYKANVEHMDRFNKEFGAVAEEDNDELEAMGVKARKPSKPSDYQTLFGGNNKDHFMVGIKFTRKSIRLYSDFYSSDIIIASPLGLITDGWS
ncbi:hypothetical protein RND81_11G079500 [Saponaria officinalis]|uniref:UTP25 NTP hydrolase-like domain-containing protein n=1 Tax=Saponaria officinalis TaxID=3572 RepID=A0AAW1HJC9_SAPOF